MYLGLRFKGDYFVARSPLPFLDVIKQGVEVVFVTRSDLLSICVNLLKYLILSHRLHPHEFVRRTHYRAMIPLFSTCSDYTLQDFSICNVGKVPRENVIKFMHCGNSNMRCVVRRAPRKNLFSEKHACQLPHRRS